MFSLIPYRRGNKLSLNDDFWGFGRNVIENFFNDPFSLGFFQPQVELGPIYVKTTKNTL